MQALVITNVTGVDHSLQQGDRLAKSSCFANGCASGVSLRGTPRRSSGAGSDTSLNRDNGCANARPVSRGGPPVRWGFAGAKLRACSVGAESGVFLSCATGISAHLSSGKDSDFFPNLNIGAGFTFRLCCRLRGPYWSSASVAGFARPIAQAFGPSNDLMCSYHPDPLTRRGIPPSRSPVARCFLRPSQASGLRCHSLRTRSASS